MTPNDTNTADIDSLTNSLFQTVARHMQRQGYNVYGKQAKAVRAQCREMVIATVAHSDAHVGEESETFSDVRKAFVSTYRGPVVE